MRNSPSVLVLAGTVAAALAGVAPSQSIVQSTLSIEAKRPAGDVNGDQAADYLRLVTGGGNRWEVVNGFSGAVLPHLTRNFGGASWTYEMVGVGDYDGDGFDDVAFYPFLGGSGQILSGQNGTTLLSLANVWVYGGTDIDSDGRSDLLLIDIGTGNYICSVRSARTGATLYSVTFNGSGGVFEPYWLVLGDENGDGHADVGLAGNDLMIGTEVMTTILRGPSATPMSGTFYRGTPAGDVNGDGISDLFVSGFGSPTAILSGDSHATIMTFPAFPTGSSRCTALGDVDGDGIDDVAIHAGGSATVFSGATQTPLATHSLPGFSVPIALGDLDRDGRAEYAIGLSRYDWVDAALPIASQMQRSGRSGTTSSGRRPTIVTRGHCSLGSTIWFDIRGCEPGSLVAFAIGSPAFVDLTAAGAPGNLLYTSMSGVSALIADGFGLAGLTAVMPVTPALIGANANVQAATFDPTANALGLVTSNAILVQTRN
jgi:hypothetical protein